jgi:hypothetical protein
MTPGPSVGMATAFGSKGAVVVVSAITESPTSMNA